MPTTGVAKSSSSSNGAMRTVLLSRAPQGFGFTLSGQEPCQISSVVDSSPASRAGLKAGDQLLAVNGIGVLRGLDHDHVVQLIADSVGVLKLQIADGVPDDDDDDEHEVMSDLESYASPKPVLMPKAMHIRGNSADSTFEPQLHQSELMQQQQQEQMMKVIKRKRHHHQSKFKSSPSKSKQFSPSKSRQVDLGGTEELQLQSTFPHLDELKKNLAPNNKVDLENAVYKAVIGYLGTIEMPEEEGDDLAQIRNCIRRLRVEKKVHTAVLFVINDLEVRLINHRGQIIAVYPADKIAFCGSCADDRRFFGLVVSSCCHVFMTEAVEDDEAEMNKRAEAFGLKRDEADGIGVFPLTADPIIDAILRVFGGNEDQPHHQQQQLQLQHSQELPQSTSSLPPSPSKLAVRAMPPPANNNYQDEQQQQPQSDLEAENNKVIDANATEMRLDAQNSAESLRQSMQKYLRSKREHLERVSERLAHNTQQQQQQQRPQSSIELPQGKLASTSEFLLGDLHKYIHSSESNLSQLSAAEALSLSNVPSIEPHHHHHHKQEQKPKPANSMILRPGDQYPSEPGVLPPPPPPPPPVVHSGPSSHPGLWNVPPFKGKRPRPLSGLSGSLASEEGGDHLIINNKVRKKEGFHA